MGRSNGGEFRDDVDGGSVRGALRACSIWATERVIGRPRLFWATWRVAQAEELAIFLAFKCISHLEDVFFSLPSAYHGKTAPRRLSQEFMSFMFMTEYADLLELSPWNSNLVHAPATNLYKYARVHVIMSELVKKMYKYAV